MASEAARGDLESSLEEHARAAAIMGYPALIEVMLRNLLENAIRYTPADGQVAVSIGTGAGQVILKVGDSGPGIPAEKSPDVLLPFHRLANASIPGTGLGLSIIARVARIHHASLELGKAERGGLQVTLRFPAAQEAHG